MKKGFVLQEILVVIAILLILASLSFKIVQAVTQKAKMISAKAQISQIALVIETCKDDTGYYPVKLEDLLEKSPPDYFQPKSWKGVS